MTDGEQHHEWMQDSSSSMTSSVQRDELAELRTQLELLRRECRRSAEMTAEIIAAYGKLFGENDACVAESRVLPDRSPCRSIEAAPYCRSAPWIKR